MRSLVSKKFNLGLCICALLLFTFSQSCKKAEKLNPVVNADDNSMSTAAKKTNVILILADDIGYEVPTCDGGQSYSTPRIDQMAAQGMRFTQCNASPMCSPSRNMFVSGKYGFRNYVNWGTLDTSNRTFGNLMKSAGYKTLVAGKWQLDGGDAAIHTFGFDDYLIYTPFQDDGYGKGSRYKDPTLYWRGSLLPKDSMKGKYGDDVIFDYVSNFIDSNKNKPFFIYYPICLSHEPFCPTPDDPEFATWDVKTSTPDKKFFPSMISYMDKVTGELIDKIKSVNLQNRTIIIWVGDNGTDGHIESDYRGNEIKGGKSKTISTGTRVPMIAWCPGKIAAHTVSNALVDFTDFLPTCADIAGVPKPTTYGPLDGLSFYSTLIGHPDTTRSWVYCYYNRNQHEQYPIQRWVNDNNYKLYDSTGLFYNVLKDPYEKAPIADSKLTPQQKQIKKNFQQVLGTMHN